MAEEDPLAIEYGEHAAVTELIDAITYCAESVSRSFDGWDDPRARGPGLYFVVVAGTSVADYADPMGANRWPTGDCRVVDRQFDAFFEAARTVGFECDGAVVVSVDGVVHEQMVRLTDRSPGGDDGDDYADWMGARHMSALDTSRRDEVVAAITVSEEDGRVTLFDDGAYEDATREELGGVWRTAD